MVDLETALPDLRLPSPRFGQPYRSLRAVARLDGDPLGVAALRVRAAVIGAGYRPAAAVKNAVSDAADDPFAIARWTMTAGTPASRIVQLLEGEGVPRAWAHERLRTRAYRAVRRGRRRLLKTLGVHR